MIYSVNYFMANSIKVKKKTAKKPKEMKCLHMQLHLCIYKCVYYVCTSTANFKIRQHIGCGNVYQLSN